MVRRPAERWYKREGIDACEVKQFAAGGACARVNECSGIDIAFGEYAGEGRIDLLEPFQLFEAPHISVGGGKVCLTLFVSAHLLVGLLRGNGVGLPQVFPAVGADLRQLHLSGSLDRK